jgi:hypothetical protein
MNELSSKSISHICELFAAHPEARVAVQQGRSYVPLLALLEHSITEVRAQLYSELVYAGLPSEEASAISLRELVLFALTTRELGSYWGIKALTWLETDFPIDSLLVEALERVAQDKRFTQNARHHSLAILKRWRERQSAE